MKTPAHILIAALSIASALTASAQPVVVSGLGHTPIGAATFGPPEGRRLPVHNLGSSGQDGVSIELNSLWGGGVEVDMNPFHGASSQARELRIRPKGWDGTIKGTLRVSSTIDGIFSESIDFRPAGAVAVAWRAMDVNGAVIGEGLADGGLMQFTYQPSSDPGQNTNWLFGAGKVSYSDLSVMIQAKGGQSAAFRATQTGQIVPEVAALEFSPVGCEGCGNPWLDVSVLEVGTLGVPDLDLCDTHLNSFSWGANQGGSYSYGGGSGRRLECWGTGGATIAEECDGPAPCSINERRLPVHNLGSSGQDGVDVRWRSAGGGGGGGSGGTIGFEMSAARGRGHVTLMKAYDDGDQELSRCSETQTADGLQLGVDCTASGAAMVRTVLYDGNGDPIAEWLVAGGVAVLDVSVLCPPGSYWTKKFINGHWHWYCQYWMDFQVPGGGTVSAAEVSMGVDSSSLVSRVSITSDDDADGIVIDDFAVIESGGTPPCDPDVNCDGSVNGFDIEATEQAVNGDYSNFCQATADLNNDGAENGFDIETEEQRVNGEPC
ncbi:hypothetical protein PHYC_00233 [Phycisphaerales bacterium]|nr:hypothetical protein PHYC_00233 [Phycisphaerales bacterium]